VVSLEKNQNKSSGFSLELEDINWIFNSYPLEAKSYTCQIRYHGEFLSCQIKIVSKIKVKVIFIKPVLVASGQSCVIYDGNICLGGGVVV
jgi:tRNA-specific 2-thiouridylase